MRIAVIGSGYVGLVTGACLADVGHHIVCVDVLEAKVKRLQQGIVDIYEPGLSELIADNISSGNMTFTTKTADAVADATAIFIAVGTPPNEDGSTDMQYVEAVAKAVGQSIGDGAVIVTKSTVPVGTCQRVDEIIAAEIEARGGGISYSVVSNPEFLKEGSAIADFARPDRIVVGCDDEYAINVMHEIYAPYNRKRDKLMVMSVRSSELTKYAANAMLATKISFINEMANVAECVGADIEQVRHGIGSDPRIGYEFIYPGCGYGGSCFPKDVKALVNFSRESGYESELLKAVEVVNEKQKGILFDHFSKAFDGNIKGLTVAVWGLAFKPNTNDMREAPSRVLMEALWEAGVTVQAFDPVAMPDAQDIFGVREDFKLAGTKEAALNGADALLICTEWKAFKVLDYEAVKSLLKQPIVVDGRNLYDPEIMSNNGFRYYGIGRGESVANI